MIFGNLDSIVRRRLLENGLHLHYYLEFLLHATSCLRELNIDTLKQVNTVELPVNDYFAVDLPSDFVDDVGVAIPVGQMLHPISKREGISPLRAVDSSGNFSTYADVDSASEQTFFGFNSNFLWWWNINDLGEPTGRWFGSHGGARANGYQVFKERRQIQLTETFTSDTIVLMYISDGQSADNATQVDVMAWQTIAAYIDWKRSGNAAFKDAPEAATFYNERRKLVARLNDLTVTDVKNIFYKAYSATLKT